MSRSTVDSEDGQNSVTPNIRMTMLQTLANRWHQWFQKLWLLQFAQKTESRTADELVRMLQIFTIGVAN